MDVEKWVRYDEGVLSMIRPYVNLHGLGYRRGMSHPFGSCNTQYRKVGTLTVPDSEKAIILSDSSSDVDKSFI